MVHAQMPANAGTVGVAGVKKFFYPHGIGEIHYVLSPYVIPVVSQVLCDHGGGGIAPNSDDEGMKAAAVRQILGIVDMAVDKLLRLDEIAVSPTEFFIVE